MLGAAPQNQGTRARPSPVLVRKGPDGKAQLVLLDHGLYQFLDEK